MRRSHHKAVLASVSACPACGYHQQAHRVCPGCGEYRGRKVISITD
jgi:large subunit ribosomal protein L32